jgi:hypothetical protein
MISWPGCEPNLKLTVFAMRDPVAIASRITLVVGIVKTGLLSELSVFQGHKFDASLSKLATVF